MQAEDAEAGEFDCPICASVLVGVCTLPCKHSFCSSCIARHASRRALSQEFSCPMCRAVHSRAALQNRDEGLEARIARSRPQEYEARVEEAAEEERRQQRLRERTQTLLLQVGNFHQMLPQGQGTPGNVHQWACFVRLSDGPHGIPDERVPDYIARVDFLLHPTFRQRLVSLSDPPFVVQRVGWGYFSIPITVHFAPRWRMPPARYVHTLSFDGEGSLAEYEVEFVEPEEGEGERAAAAAAAGEDVGAAAAAHASDRADEGAGAGGAAGGAGDSPEGPRAARRSGRGRGDSGGSREEDLAPAERRVPEREISLASDVDVDTSTHVDIDPGAGPPGAAPGAGGDADEDGGGRGTPRRRVS
eukprot:tig00021339_g20438.t1